MTPASHLSDFDKTLASYAGQPIGVAVSGGGDSVALLRILCDWGQAAQLHVATVDHGLRDAAVEEATFVAGLCARLGLPHQTLHWSDWDGQGNLLAAARDARLQLLGQWARDNDLAAVCLGHTQDDQAETVLLRLARGSGVDGLSGMRAERQIAGMTWLRPLLATSRAALRTYLRDQGQDWRDDPTNDDDRFDRIRLRKSAPILDDLGLTNERLAHTAATLGRVRSYLDDQTRTLAHAVAEPTDIGSVHIDVNGFKAAHPELQMRLLAHCIRWITGATYAPRSAGLERLAQALSLGAAHTLAGCQLTPCRQGSAELVRELRDIQRGTIENCVFSCVWRLSFDSVPDGASLQPLGERGLGYRPQWRNTQYSRAAIVSSPSLWYGSRLKSAPFLDKDPAWTFMHLPGRAGFYATILSH